MSQYLAVSNETGSVIAEGRDLRALVQRVADLGHDSGYVTNQDGGREDIARLIERYGIELGRNLEHWHVALSDEDESRFYPLGFWEMVNYAASELQMVAEFEHEGFRIYSDSGDHEEGYSHYLASESADVQRLNLENISRQHESTDEDRAPVWIAMDENTFRERALSILADVTAIQVYQCSESECVEHWEAEEGTQWEAEEMSE